MPPPAKKAARPSTPSGKPRKRSAAAAGSPLAPQAPPLSFFVAGIIQGSLPGANIHDQDYRREATRALRGRYPRADVFDPFETHPESVGYDHETGRDVFFDLMERAGRADVVVAFVPSASMGTAIELWNAFHAGAVVAVVSPLVDNWVVKFLADIVLPDLDAWKTWLDDGGLDRLIERKITYRKR